MIKLIKSEILPSKILNDTNDSFNNSIMVIAIIRESNTILYQQLPEKKQ
jgi:hypothetical protein